MQVDKSGDLSEDEMMAFFICLTNAAFKVGLVNNRPTFRQLIYVVRGRATQHSCCSRDYTSHNSLHLGSPLLLLQGTSMFEMADTDDSRTVDRSEFVKWARQNVASRSLVNSFRAVAKAESRLRRKALRAVKHGDMRAMKLMGAQDDNVQELLRKQRFERLTKQRERLISGHKQLAKTTQFTVHELKRIKNLFMKKANGVSLDLDAFVEVMTSEWPSLKRETLEPLFHSFDTDHSNDVDYVELITGLGKMVDGTQKGQC
mgnify:CR=1 FL=1